MKKFSKKTTLSLIITVLLLPSGLNLVYSNLVDILPFGHYNQTRSVLAQETSMTCDEKIATGEAITKAEELATGTITKVNALLYYISEEEKKVNELLALADQCSAGNCGTGCGSTGTRTCNPHPCDPSNVTTRCTSGYSCHVPEDSANYPYTYPETGADVIREGWSLKDCEHLPNNHLCLEYCNASYCKSNPGSCSCYGKTCQVWQDTIFAPFHFSPVPPPSPGYEDWCRIEWPTCYDACPACEAISCDLSSTTACPFDEINTKFNEINSLYSGTPGIAATAREIEILIRGQGVWPLEPDLDDDVLFASPSPTNMREYIKLKLDVAGGKLQQCISTIEDFEAGSPGKILFKCPLALDGKMLPEGYPEENCYYYPNNYVCCKY